MASRTQLAQLAGNTNWVRSVAFSPDGATLASGSYDNSVRLWSVAAFRSALRQPAPFSPQEHR